MTPTHREWPTKRAQTGVTEAVFETAVRGGVCQLRRPGTRWLSSGHAGGASRGPVAYNVSVPEGWPGTDLGTYAAERRARAGFGTPGPTLFTGVDLRHARRARLDPVEAVVTAGASNPAALPVGAAGSDVSTPRSGTEDGDGEEGDADDPPGTVNVVVGTTRALAPGALANLLAVAAEAKAATLLARVGVPGTTTDAVLAACDPEGPVAEFSGSATTVGRAARACVRDALLAGLDSRYADADPPASVDEAEHGVTTDVRARVSRL